MFNQLDYIRAITVRQYTGQEGLHLYNRHNYLKDFKGSVEKFTTICSVFERHSLFSCVLESQKSTVQN